MSLSQQLCGAMLGAEVGGIEERCTHVIRSSAERNDNKHGMGGLQEIIFKHRL